MKLGFLTVPFADLSLKEVALWARENGFSALEIAAWPRNLGHARRYAGTCHLDVNALSKDEAQQIKGEMRENGLEISALAYYPNPLDSDEGKAQAVIAHLQEVIRAAQLLQVKTVGTFIGRDQRCSVEENFVRFEQIWPDIVRFAADHEVRIAIENCPMIFFRQGMARRHQPCLLSGALAADVRDNSGREFWPEF